MRGWQPSQRPPEPSTPATPTTWSSPETNRLPARSQRFKVHVAAIAIEEGFAIQHRKTRVMRQGVSQRAAGIVINQKINMPRDDYDRLKAILCNW